MLKYILKPLSKKKLNASLLQKKGHGFNFLRHTNFFYKGHDKNLILVKHNTTEHLALKKALKFFCCFFSRIKTTYIDILDTQ